MKPRRIWVICTALAAGWALALTGCPEPGQAELEPILPQPPPTAEAPAAETRMEGTVVRSSGPLPTYDKASSVILLEKVAPAKVRVGEEFWYQLKVVNLTRSKIEQVAVTNDFPANFKFSRAEPAADRARENQLTWDLRTLEPKQERLLRVHGTATGVGEMTGCTRVTYKNPPVCLSFQAVQPQLQLAKSMPGQVMVCEQMPVRMVVSNPGSGEARNVRITDSLPEGLATLDGKSEIAFDVGTLAPGQSREFTMNLKASKVGRYINKATAAGEGGLVADASSETMVRQPVLVITKSAPAMRYVGRPVMYEITVSNRGDAEARNTVLTDTLPAGADFVSASEGGKLAAGKVTWELGTLAAGASQEVSVTVRGNRRGTLRNSVAAEAFCASASAEAVTQVRGIPAILLEVIDLADPIEVGGQETYVITVTNQGSADGTNIRIVCTLPAEQEFVSAKGPTEAAHKDGTVTFQPVPTLGPKKKAVYRVTVKGSETGDVRFRVRLTSDQMDSPAEESESTHIYQ